MDFFPQTFTFPSTFFILNKMSTPFSWRNFKRTPMPRGSLNPIISPRGRGYSCWRKSTSSRKLSLEPTSTQPSKTFRPMMFGSYRVTSTTPCSSEAKSSICVCIVWSLHTVRLKPGSLTRVSEGSVMSFIPRMWPKLTTCSCTWRMWPFRNTAKNIRVIMEVNGRPRTSSFI